jgi:hypothetical protein
MTGEAPNKEDLERTYEKWDAKISAASTARLSDDERDALLGLIHAPVFIRACAILVNDSEARTRAVLHLDLRTPEGLQRAIDAQQQVKANISALDNFWNLAKEPGR